MDLMRQNQEKSNNYQFIKNIMIITFINNTYQLFHIIGLNNIIYYVIEVDVIHINQ
jgi:hypothetical protein